MSRLYCLFFFAIFCVSMFTSSVIRRNIYQGQATWFDTSVGKGACGDQNSNSDHIVALNSAQYSSGAHCHKRVKIHNMKTGAVIVARILDECPTCNYGDLDLTPDTFKAIASLDDGIAKIHWYFI